jgi:hypothetical protein
MLTSEQQKKLADRMSKELGDSQPISPTEMLDAARYELLLMRHDQDYRKGAVQ